MHECPFCGEVCDCDMDDTWDLPIPDDCPHVCAPQIYDDDFSDGVDMSWDDPDGPVMERRQYTALPFLFWWVAWVPGAFWRTVYFYPRGGKMGD